MIYNKKRKLNKLKASLLLLMLVCFAGAATAQTNVYMHSGTQSFTQGVTSFNFYDSGGASSVDGSYYWEKWYQHNENATIVFKNGNNPIQVSFGKFDAWGDSADGNSVVKLGEFSLRINNDHLYVYDGENADDEKLICDLTGTLTEPFTLSANGPITFKFVSDGQYRDEGWAATVTSTNTYTVQQPIITKETCSDYVILYNTANGGQIYYSTDGNDPEVPSKDPLSTGTLYNGPFAIDLDDDDASVIVKAIVVANGQTSAVASHTFTHRDQRPTPGAPVINIDGNTVTFVPDAVPAGLNETYNIRYTTNGTDPSATNGTLLTKSTGFSIEWHTPNTTFKAVTVAVTCSSKVSSVTSKQFGNVTVPTPTITFDNQGKATITCSLDGATIYYTTDGTQPTTSSPHGTTPVTTAALPIGTTVYAYAVFDAEGYDDSAVGSAIYVPENGSGTYGDVVFLDDREDHTWSYYSDGDQPIRSLNPADVKIAYFGNGTGTVTTSTNANPGADTWAQNATGVQVSYNESENQFIYLKTLERVDGATSNNPTGRCEYTTIPNPFSKRPTYGSGDSRWRGFYGWRIKSIHGGKIYSAATGGTEYTAYTSGNLATTNYLNAETAYYFAPDSDKGMEVELEALWARAYVSDTRSSGGGLFSSYYYYTVTNTTVGYERNFVVLSQDNNAYGIGVNSGNRITNSNNRAFTATRRYPDGSAGSSTGATIGGVTLSANTKMEFIAVSGMNNSTLNAAGHDLIIGRGVSGTVGTLAGLSANSTNTFRMRIESGSYNKIYFMGDYGVTTGHLTATLGSDYDRAKKDDSKLGMTGNTPDILVSNEGTVGSTGTVGTERFKCTVKSGNFDLGTYGGAYQFYLSSPNGNNYGSRSLLVEGGIFSDISGGWDTEVTNTNQDKVTIRIKGGTIKGAVYGAAQFSNAYGNRRIVITGGTFAGWIAGGANGTKETNGTLNGTSYVYVGGNANVTGNNTVMNRAIGGNVFGAGCGYNASSTSGQVTGGTNVVIADNAIIQRGVYGGGSYGYTTATANVYILGGTVNCEAGGVNGTTYTANIKGGVFGGACQNQGGITNITMKDGTVNGGVYGGSNYNGAISGLATVNISGGTAENVFGGGLGSSTSMAVGTVVNVSGGTINNNVYGGGEEGTVTGNTEVTFSGGTVNDIYGAGKGSSSQRANIAGSTTVAVTGGTVNGSVYGGGQNGTVAYASGGANNTNYKSTVGVSGGEVKGNVYGGGKMGTSQVATTVNISNGTIRGHVFGGAEGEQKKVFVTGMRTVNMTGGHVYGNVYGGSQNANDGNNTTLTDGSFSTSTETATMCVTNISGGVIDENVYAAGYFGNCFGSVYVFIGKDAIQNAPYKQPTTGIDYKVATLSITGTVWAGGDWGTFSGTFGDGTISGNANIYVDGNGYETTTQQASNAQYMNIGGSILSCGTSCYGGKEERTVIIRNYGTAQGAQPTEASRTLYSIQFAKVLIFDNSNINFSGQGRANDLNQTEKYSLYEIYNDDKTTNLDTDVDGVRIVNGSGLFLNAPVTQIANFRSMSCDNTFASVTPTLDGYTAITPTTLSGCNNQVRVNNGNYIEIKWGSNYGALIGYAHMMSSNNDEDATCAYARPRWCTGAAFNQNSGTDNPNDGGWISYDSDDNTFALDGTTGDVQMAYENHTVRNGEQYFRVWRQGGTEHYREGVFNAHASGTDTWKTVDVVITLPAFRDPANYYCFETNGDATTIDYGADVLMWNAARETGTGDDWMYYKENSATQIEDLEQTHHHIGSTLTEMKKNANVNFGLVILPDTGMGGSDYIICYEADNNLADTDTKFTKADNTVEPQIRFRLTYYDKLTSNMTWDPSTIVLVQKDAQGNVVDRVTVSLAVSTSSTIEQEFSTKLYAIMQGKGSTAETFNAKVVLPSFAANLYSTGKPANFTLNSVDFEAAHGGNLIARAGSYNINNYAVGYAAGLNEDNTDGWNAEGNYTEQDAYPMTLNNPSATSIGKTGGRTVFAIDFTLHYDGSQTVTTEELIGTLTFNFTFDNYTDDDGNEITQPLTIIVEVYRRGQGTKFYIDGINGSNANDARHPDKAVKQLSTIFNRCGYMGGDEIYIVNQVTADKQLDWNGLPYNNVIIYRYNGGHELSATDASIEGNPDNTAYLGNLLNVTNHMTMEGITLDGYYNNGETTYTTEDPQTHEQIIHDTDENGGPHTVTATASMITVAQGGTLELSTGTVLQNNNSSSVNGAAVNVANNGKLMMNQDATIKDNVTTGDGAGVYMAGNMVVSDNIQIIDNKKNGAQNNVFLSAADKMITIGTSAGNDAYGELGENAKIGVTKALSADIDGTYTRVVNVDQDVEWLETPFNSNPNSIIYHDGQKYQLVKYTDPKILYWVGTWVTLQDHVPTAEEGGWPYTSSTTTFDINTEYQFAWIISLVNGENNQTPDNFSGKTINILADIDMDESIWVPIGTDAHPFKGTLKGNGHLIENMHSSLVQDYMGMLGYAEGATVQDVMAAVNFDANSANMGAVAGVMKTTTISNVEAAGTITGGSNTVNMGGIVGDVQSGTIHSSFAVCDLTGTTETVMGGLVGTNGGNLYNSFANTTMTGATQMGGLVGENKANCHVENCYVNLGQMEIPAFAYTNKGEITYCYASKAGQYVAPETVVEGNLAPTKSGIFAPVKGRKEIGYMYGDNLVTAPAENTYANHENHEYLNNHTVVWNGLLSVLNQWVADGHTSYSTWYRPTTQDINGDLPVLAFPKDNCVGNYAEEDGKFLRYSAYDLTAGENFNNGLDNLFAYYSGKAANIFLYNNATDVANGSGNANLFINEDAVLLQSGSDAINATVGVTFDNSCKNAYDYYGNNLNYDWHMMSSPLSNAEFTAEYGAQSAYGQPVNMTKLEDSYFPNNLPMQTGQSVKWDFYSYSEPDYHWINLRRGSDSHWYMDHPTTHIDYDNEDHFIPGKGYMMAINQDTYMSDNGTLNNGGVPITITLTNAEPESIGDYNKGWNLVGNPYQAYLDLSKIGGAFYIYDADKKVYAPVVQGSSVNTEIPSTIVHPHQAFFMYSATNDNKFTFDYSWATTEKENGSYFRGDKLNYPLVNLFAENERGNRDMAVIELERPELGGATKVKGLRNANFNISAHLDGQSYGLVFTPEGTERIPVHFIADENGTYTLRWNTQNGEFTSLRLVDNLTGTNYDMLANDHYTFTASTEDYASRFYITYTVTDVDENVDGESNFAYFDGTDWVINGQGTLDVVDVLGRTLFSQRLTNDQNRFNLNGVAKGVYLLRVSNGKNTMVQKIVVR